MTERVTGHDEVHGAPLLSFPSLASELFTMTGAGGRVGLGSVEQWCGLLHGMAVSLVEQSLGWQQVSRSSHGVGASRSSHGVQGSSCSRELQVESQGSRGHVAEAKLVLDTLTVQDFVCTGPLV